MTKTSNSSFQLRLISALILAPVILAVIYYGGFLFSLFLIGAALMSLYEWFRMTRTSLPIVIFGVGYLSLSFVAMDWIRNIAPNGFYNFLTLLLIVWASDIFAYVTGKAVGGPKLAPSISPKKTWAGFVGSSAGAALVAAAMACPWVLDRLQAETIGGLGMTSYAVIGFILAMFGQAGDLLISIFKRKFGLKDTGTLIPGHGGILDRIDALLLVAILFAMIIAVRGG